MQLCFHLKLCCDFDLQHSHFYWYNYYIILASNCLISIFDTVTYNKIFLSKELLMKDFSPSGPIIRSTSPFFLMSKKRLCDFKIVLFNNCDETPCHFQVSVKERFKDWFLISLFGPLNEFVYGTISIGTLFWAFSLLYCF